jgi:2-aminoethylphosphonate-pyruvate transaminase
MNKYLLLNPGPVNLDERVKIAATSIDLCHRQEEFIDILMRVKRKLKKASGKLQSNISILHGSGTLAVESAMQTFISGDVLVINNGEYCQRIENSIKYNSDCKLFSLCFKTGEYPDLDRVRSCFDRHYDWVCVVHHETSTGILNPVSEICDLAQEFGCKVFVDAVSSFGAHHVDPRSNVICFNSNKCLESIPGAAIVVWDNNLIRCRDTLAYLDATSYREEQIPFTPNTNAIVALDTALDIFFKEDRYDRYDHISSYVRKVGSKYYPLFLTDYYSNVLNSFVVDDNKYEMLYQTAKDRNFILYAGKMHGQFRIANMGVEITLSKVDELFDCIGGIL